MTSKEAKACNILKQLLGWSDRLGSDEVYTIQEVIELLEKEECETD